MEDGIQQKLSGDFQREVDSNKEIANITFYLYTRLRWC